MSGFRHLFAISGLFSYYIEAAIPGVKRAKQFMPMEGK